MAMSPQQFAEKRTEFAVTKLCDTIDKKLLESQELPFRFTFFSNVGSHTINTILDIYQNMGWYAYVHREEDSSTLVLSNVPTTEALNSLGHNSPPTYQNPAPIDYNEQRNQIISMAMETPDGREALCNAMHEPINTSLRYLGAARKILIEDCQTNAINSNSIDKFVVSSRDMEQIVWDGNSAKLCFHNENIDLNGGPKVFVSEIELPDDRQPFHVVDRLQVMVKDQINEWEMNGLLDVFAAIRERFPETVIHSYIDTFKKALEDAVAEIEGEGAMPSKIFMSPRTYRRMNDYFEVERVYAATQQDVIASGLYGQWDICDIHAYNSIPDNLVFILPLAKQFGVFCPIQRVKATALTVSGSKYSVTVEIQSAMRIVNPQYMRTLKFRF